MQKEKQMKKSNRERLLNLRKAIDFVLFYARKHMVLIILYTLIGMSGAAVGVFGSLVSRDLVDIITGHKTGELFRTFGMILLIQVITIAINNLSTYISARITNTVGNIIKADIYDQIMTTEWESLLPFHSGQIMSRWSGDSATISQGILTIVPNAIIYVFRFGYAFYMVVRNDWTFAVIAIAAVPFSLLVSRTNLKRMQKLNMETIEFSAKMSSFTQESFSNVQNVKALDMVKVYCSSLRELQKEQFSLNMLTQRISILNSILLTVVSQFFSYFIYGWGIYRVWSGDITYGTMTMFLALSQTLSGTVTSMINLVPNSISMLNAVARVRDIIELPKESYEMNDEVTEFFQVHQNSGIGVKLYDIDFSYQGGGQVLSDATFEAYPREVVGIVGPSGEGKTTMLRMILALIRPQEGEGKICAGMDEKQSMMITASTRQLISYVPQGNSMFPGTIAENMRMVREDMTDDEIKDALKIACAWDFVSKLPDGINTALKERGGGLSEGQAQRLAIARAIVRRTPILLLDEATSALDIENEARILENIKRDSYPRTCILTTHKVEVMKTCDRIYRVADCELKEEKN